MSTLAMPLMPRAARRAALGQVVLNEARLTWRRPVPMIGGAAVPLLLIVVFGNVSVFQQKSASFGGITPFDAYVPILVVFSLSMLALLGLPIPLVSHRELGVLRRLSTTPVPPAWLLVAQGLIQAAIATITTVVLLVVSMTAFGLSAPKSPGGLVLSFLLATAGLFAIGLTIASLARTSGSVNIIGRLVFFPLMFFAGLWLPRAVMPAGLRDVSNYTPVGAAVEAIQDSMQTGFPPVAPLLVLAAYVIVFGFLAKRLFRWE
jgi:ABC-2 type transport system permease protein